MASNPDPITITKKTIIKVADNINTVTLHLLNSDSNYFMYYKLTGQAAPTENDLPNFVKFFEDFGKQSIVSDTLIDIYFYCPNGNGKIRVDEGVNIIPGGQS